MVLGMCVLLSPGLHCGISNISASALQYLDIRERRRRRRRKEIICLTSNLNDEGMAACGLLGIFITPELLGSLSKVSCY